MIFLPSTHRIVHGSLLQWSVLFLNASFISFLIPVPLFANPQGGVVVEGSATIVQRSPTRLDINQHSDRAVVDWQGFSIAAHEHTHFQQPSSGSVSLNRVTGGDPSHIFGQLTSNGQIFLVNPHGILFGSDSRVDVAGLLATTSNISNSDFMAGRFEFSAPVDSYAGVVNRGDITVDEGGMVALVAPWVENSGTITARLGSVSLVSGNNFTLDLYGDQLVQLAIDDTVLGEVSGTSGESPEALVTNSGNITTDGGRVEISVATAQHALDTVINMDGVVQAQTIQEHKGEIFLQGGETGVVNVTGRIDASGYDEGETGGQVVILGEQVGLFASHTEETTHIDASGDTGGGTVLVGGNYQGNGPEPNAQATYVAADATIQADAMTEGDGGTVVVWADEVTKFYGSISARGGHQSGNGGLVETSGKEYLEVIGARVDASAPHGFAGEWLLDPRDVTIQNTASSNGSFDSGSPNTFTPSGDSAVADRGTIQTSLDGGTDVTITTGTTGTQNGDITVTDSITKSAGGNATLTLNAVGGITINNAISSAGNQLDLDLTAGGGNITQSSSGILTVDGTTTLSASGADITLGESNNFGTVIVSAADNVTLVDTNGIDLGASTISGDLDLTASDTITDSGNLSIAGRVTLAAGSGNDITLDEAGNDFQDRVSITSGNNVTLRDTNGIEIGTSTVSGDFGITANGLIEDVGNIDVAGTTTLAAGAGNNITLDRPGNDFNTVQITTGNNVTLRDTDDIDLGTSTISGTLDLTAGGPVTNSGALTVTNATTIAAGAGNDVTLTNGSNDFSTLSITSANNVAITDTNGFDLGASTVSGTLDVTASGTVTDSGTVAVTGTTTLAAGAGNDITLDEAASDFSTVSITSGNNVAVTDTNGLDLGASTVSGTLDVTASGTVTDSGTLNVTGTTTLAAGAGNDITLDEAASDFSTVSFTSGNNVAVTDTNGLDLGASTVSGTLDVTASGAVTDSGTLTVTDTTTLAAGAGNNITLDDAASDFSTLSITSGNNVDITDTNALNLGVSTIAGTFDVTTNGAITDSGTLTITGTTTLAAGAANDITLDTSTNDFSTVGITSANNVTLVDINTIDLTTSTVSGNLDVTANGAITTSGILSVSGTQTLTDTTASSSSSSNSSGATTTQTNTALITANQARESFSQEKSTFGNDTGFAGFDFSFLAQLTSSMGEKDEEEEEETNKGDEEEEEQEDTI